MATSGNYSRSIGNRSLSKDERHCPVGVTQR